MPQDGPTGTETESLRFQIKSTKERKKIKRRKGRKGAHGCETSWWKLPAKG